MIDDPDQVDRLLSRIRAALPLPARLTQHLLASLRDQNQARPPAAACRITRVDYAGDAGGIVCHLARDGEDQSGRLVVTSITHLDFDPRAAHRPRDRRLPEAPHQATQARSANA